MGFECDVLSVENFRINRNLKYTQRVSMRMQFFGMPVIHTIRLVQCHLQSTNLSFETWCTVRIHTRMDGYVHTCI